ncbi:hypothetical protein [Metamycoplasma equirhinis]|uniref:hypothetical protein n=1 Tax=Metamycoplasma equirhinis TaxID=92402 RepID=UPI0035948C50
MKKFLKLAIPFATVLPIATLAISCGDPKAKDQKNEDQSKENQKDNNKKSPDSEKSFDLSPIKKFLADKINNEIKNETDKDKYKDLNVEKLIEIINKSIDILAGAVFKIGKELNITKEIEKIWKEAFEKSPEDFLDLKKLMEKSQQFALKATVVLENFIKQDKEIQEVIKKHDYKFESFDKFRNEIAAGFDYQSFSKVLENMQIELEKEFKHDENESDEKRMKDAFIYYKKLVGKFYDSKDSVIDACFPEKKNEKEVANYKFYRDFAKVVFAKIAVPLKGAFDKIIDLSLEIRLDLVAKLFLSLVA